MFNVPVIFDCRTKTEWDLEANTVYPKGFMIFEQNPESREITKLKIANGIDKLSDLQYTNAVKSDIPTKTSQLENDSGFLTKETDPTVPAWAKADEKPVYTAEEVGAAAKSHTHTKSQITDFPASLPANGGNADTVDGKHASDFAADITAAVNAVEIGGRNIARETAAMTPGVNGTGSWNRGTWRSNVSWGTLSVVEITDSPVEGNSKAARLTVSDVKNGCCIMQQFTPLVKGQQYVLSCWIRGTVPKAQLEVYYGTPVRGGLTTVNVTSQWQKVYATCGNTEKFNVPQETKPYSASTVYILPQNIGDYIEVCGLKLEKGNRPTDWTPAPEDAERRITSLEARVAALEAAAVSGGEV